MRTGSKNMKRPLLRRRSTLLSYDSSHFSDYCKFSSIHGVKYVGEKNRIVGERIIWIIVVAIMCLLCLWLVIKGYLKLTNVPTISTVSKTKTPIWDIPFPAVTICPSVKFDPNVFNYTDVFLRKHFNESTTKLEDEFFESASLICRSTVQYQYLPIVNKKTIYNLFLASQRIPTAVTWEGKPLKDTKTISTIRTSEGECLTFNMNHLEDILVDPDECLSKCQGSDKSISSARKEIYPKHSSSCGAKGGVSFDLVTDSSALDYLCSGPLQGYKVMVHYPNEIPKIEKQFWLPLDQSLSIRVRPNVMTTPENLKSYNPQIRNCYFEDERRLSYFRNYTQANCLLECESNYTLSKCGCVGFYMPKGNNTPICGPARISCLQDNLKSNTFRDALETQVPLRKTPQKNMKLKSLCDCLPSCNFVNFEFDTSQMEWKWREMLQVLSNLNGSSGSFNSMYNLSRLEVYYESSEAETKQKREVYGVIDFLASLGGFLSLFLGFSATSLLEIAYFIIFRRNN